MISLSSLIDIDPDENYYDNDFSNNEVLHQSEYVSVEQYNDICKREKNLFTVLSNNIRSFHRNIDSFNAMFDNCSFPDALIFSETWFSEDYQDDLPGYYPFHTVRSGRRSGGVSIFIRSFTSNLIQPLSYCNNEIEICTVKVILNNDILVIAGIYRPHSGTIEGFIDELRILFNSSLVGDCRCIIAGDFNINLCSQSNDVQRFIEFMQSYHYLPVISKPTRFPPNNLSLPSLLDHIWTNKISIYNSGILLNDLTDHCPTYYKFPHSNPESNSNSKIKISFRHQNDDNRTKFKQSLESFDWNLVKSDDVNIYCDNFVNTLNRLFCEAFPLKVKHVSTKQATNPWISRNVRDVIKLKSHYFKLFKLGFVTRGENNAFRNRVTSMITKTKSRYYKQLFERNRNDIRSTWQTIHNLTGRKSSHDAVKNLLWNGVEFSNSNEISNIFNNYFSTVANDLNNELPDNDANPLDYLIDNVPSSFFFSPITLYECSEIIKNLKNSKQDKNKITINLLIANRHFISRIICDLFNKCISDAIFPQSLKIACVIPIHKKGVTSDPSNFRPISMLPVMSKIFERLIFNRFSKFFSDHSVFTPTQFGFMKNKSTLDAIVNLTEQLYESLNSREHAITVFIDYSKAFDTVNHAILLSKLEKYGIRGLPLKLIRSYLLDRTQVVKCNNSFSSSKIINIGVPQGSILGPLLFLIYINDLPSISCNFSSTLFADDTTLLFRHKSSDSLIISCNNELNKFKTWSEANRLSISLEKTFGLLVSNRNFSEGLDGFFLGSQSLKFVDSCKFLGVNLDSRLSFEVHIGVICRKVSKSIGILYKLKSFVPKSCLLTIYYSFIYPYLIYCLPIWGSTGASLLKPLVILQKRAVRIINLASYLDHTEPLFYNCKILKLEDLYFFSLAIYAYKNINYLDNFSRNHTYNTRNQNDLLPPFERLSRSQQSVFFNAIKVWNSLSVHLKNSPNIFSFKRHLKNMLLSKYHDPDGNA